MNSQINPFRLNETTPNFYGTCIVTSIIYLYKKVNFVENVTYEVLSRQRRYVESIGHIIDDVIVTQLSLGPNISKKARDRGFVTMGHE